MPSQPPPAAGRSGNGSALPADPRAVAEHLAQFVREQLLPPGAPAFDAATPLSAIGLDSFALIELLLAAETHWGVRLPDAELTPANLHDLHALAASLVRACGGAPIPR